ncbi:MAG TPA: S46 family peptidase [Flavipsychrobacter sp.]|nr:S46 family peptidase [Flavipsychrobacter sp.]
MGYTHFGGNFLKKTVLFTAIVGSSFPAFSKEGMWLPPTLKQREADMKEMGLQIPIEKLYNADGTGLNNAVVLFGKGCTGEVISSKGLILTNHHCGYGTVQGLSSKENDYFAKGFFAMNNKEEIPCPGLTVTFIRKMENVSDLILFDIPDTLSEAKRDSIVAGRIKGLEKGYRYTTKMDASIRPYFNGNQYWVIISETYTDIRLVGFPPNGIGQFGGDTDNWMWPRHTGDFAMFRIYAGKNNKPAAHSANNKPYETKNFFTINTSGYKEGDFTMVYGFPGTTQEYISSYQLNQVYAISDPIRIDVRTKKLDVWTKHMSADREVFLKYTSKRAGIANGWKKWQGEVRGLKLNDVVGKKAEYENEFQAWANSDGALPYSKDLLANIYANTSRADSALKADLYIQEAVYGIEIIAQAALLDKMLQTMRAKLLETTLRDSLEKLSKSLAGFYKNYDAATDKNLFTELMPMYFRNSGAWVPAAYGKSYREYNRDFVSWANDVFNISLLAEPNRLQQFAESAALKDTMRILSDPAWRLYNGITTYRRSTIMPIISRYNNALTYYNRLYMKSRMKKDWNTMFYPDANLTLRLTYGKLEGMDPDGPAGYSFQTNLDQAIAKDNPEVEEFRVPQKLKDLHAAKDYGRWAVDGTVPLAFIASNHTSGGNSGSPVLNAKGQLIGTNFDRVWEGTMSDYYFDPRLCRNISVDIRYTLFIIEKFGGAGWLLNEMKLVKN